MPSLMRNPTTARRSFARPDTGRRLPERGEAGILGENQTAQSGAWNAIPEPDGLSASTGKAAATMIADPSTPRDQSQPQDPESPSAERSVPSLEDIRDAHFRLIRMLAFIDRTRQRGIRFVAKDDGGYSFWTPDGLPDEVEERILDEPRLFHAMLKKFPSLARLDVDGPGGSERAYWHVLELMNAVENDFDLTADPLEVTEWLCDFAYQWRLSQLQKLPYSEYLKSPHWQRIRQSALKRAGGRCQLCNAQNRPLDTHHRTYERRGCEEPEDVIVLCRDCHAKFHGKLP